MSWTRLCDHHNLVLELKQLYIQHQRCHFQHQMITTFDVPLLLDNKQQNFLNATASPQQKLSSMLLDSHSYDRLKTMKYHL